MHAGHSETELSVGLGHAATLLCVLSRLLDTRLGFPIAQAGSSAAVIANFTSAGFRDAERRLPRFHSHHLSEPTVPLCDGRAGFPCALCAVTGRASPTPSTS